LTLTRLEPETLFVGTTARVSHRRIPYEPALDGLRGVAVLAVVLYHGGVTWASGGYLGVDAFFVLSGYLITTLLLAEWRDTGTIALVSFWARRARRLLPAVFVLLIGIAAYSAFVAQPDVLDQLRADGVSTLFYVMNWRLIASSQSYFDQFFASPLRHMWSLAIEEQYYLVWPLVTLAVLRWRRSARVLLQVCLVLAALSAAVMFVLYDPDVDPSRLYYGTDTRAQSLLLGSALAAAIASGLAFRTLATRRAVVNAATVLVVLLAWAWTGLAPFGLPPSSGLLYRGGFVLLASSVCLLILACTQVGANPIRRALSFEPLRRLGLISYGVYLVHWPIYSWLDAERTGLAPGSLRLLAVRLGVTLVVALASYLLIEKPIREGSLGRVLPDAAQAWLLPASLAVVLTLIIATTNGGRASIPTPAVYDPALRPPPSLSADVAPEDQLKVLLVGDSVAFTLGDKGFEGEVAEANGLAFWNQAILFCELIPGAHRQDGEVRGASDTCVDWERDWRRTVELWDPAISVLQLGAWEIFDREIDGEWVEFGTPEYDEVLVPVLQRAVDALSSQGAPVVVVTTPPFLRDDGVKTDWTQNERRRTDHFNELLRDLAAANPDTVHLIELGDHVCPGGECPDQIDGIEMRPDGLHYGDGDAKLVARWLAPQLRAAIESMTSVPPGGSASTRSTGPGGTAPPGTDGPTTTAAPATTDPPASATDPGAGSDETPAEADAGEPLP
jgi:peptidoglycan/LPS O-acetylase OafA/YrhL